MLIYCICTQYLVGAPFASITASIRHGMEVISLWHCWGGMEAQVALIAAFRSSALLGLVSLIFLLTIPYILYGVQVRRVCWPIKHSNTMVIEPAFGTFGSVCRCQVLLEKEISISIKLCQQKEAWSALKFPGRWLRWLWTSENTVDQHQQMTWQPKSSLTVETSHWTSSNMDSVPLQSSSRLWDLVSKWNAKFTFIWKEDFGPLSYFSPQPGKMLLTLSLVQKWLGSPFPEDVWAW